MKEIFGWLAWTWGNWKPWQRMFILAMILNVGSVFFPDPYHWYVNGAGMAIVVLYMLKWFVWDSIMESWRKYKQHRNELFNTIKSSDC